MQIHYVSKYEKNDELKHYGVMGMHWGIRRYQPYPDGSKAKGYRKKMLSKIDKNAASGNMDKKQIIAKERNKIVSSSNIVSNAISTIGASSGLLLSIAGAGTLNPVLAMTGLSIAAGSSAASIGGHLVQRALKKYKLNILDDLSSSKWYIN